MLGTVVADRGVYLFLRGHALGLVTQSSKHSAIIIGSGGATACNGPYGVPRHSNRYV